MRRNANGVVPLTDLRFHVSMPRPESHLFHVEMRTRGWGEPELTLVFPTWIPGSYLVREFERHVEGMECRGGDGRALPFRKVAKNRWRIDAREAGGTIEARFRVFAREWSVRTCHLDDSHAFWNGTGLFPFPLGHPGLPVDVEVEAPAGWGIATALEPLPDGGGRTFRARDFDELYDSPFEVGPHEVREVAAAGRTVRVAFAGSGNEDRERLARDVGTIVETQAEMWGGLPYPRYTFIVHLGPAGSRGGLEHMDSSVLSVGRWDFQARDRYIDVLGLASHEHFHAWNVKRLRPAAFRRYDYETENHTRLLWLMEGVTSYYDNLLVRRAGLISTTEYLVLLARDLKALDETPGRRLQSLELASYDAWIKLYRRDEHTRNSTVSYYLKGSLLALCMDLLIRRGTAGRRSLDDVMRLLYRRHALPHGTGIPEDGVLPAVEEVSGGAWGEFFERYVAGTDELPVDEALAAAGLRLQRGDPKAAKASLGARLDDARGFARIAEVLAGGPADRAGLSAGDEVVAVDGLRIDGASLASRIAERKPGEQVALTLFRDDRLLERRVELGTQHGEYQVLPLEETTAEQRGLFAAWTGAPWPLDPAAAGPDSPPPPAGPTGAPGRDR